MTPRNDVSLDRVAIHVDILSLNPAASIAREMFPLANLTISAMRIGVALVVLRDIWALTLHFDRLAFAPLSDVSL